MAKRKSFKRKERERKEIFQKRQKDPKQIMQFWSNKT